MDIFKAVILALHIISAGTWISQFPAEMILHRFMLAQPDKPSELTLFSAQNRLASMLGQIGGMGILVTGLTLLVIDHFSLLGIGGYTPTWLFIKQSFYIIAMIIVPAVFVPGEKLLRPKLVEAAKAGTGLTPEILQIRARMTIASRVINLIVLTNILLALWKPTA